MNNQEMLINAKNMLIVDGINKIKGIGYNQVDISNILTNVVYSQLFKNHLDSLRGQDDRLDHVIDDILIDMFNEQKICN